MMGGKFMKKRFTSALALIIFSIALVAVSFVPANNTDTTSGNLKTGLAISTSIKDSVSATEEEGANSTNITVAAVTVDGDGKIVSCKIDVLSATVKFNTSGIITSDLTADCLTKKEIKDGYGMKQYSSIQKEWYEQVEAFENYCIGKTADDILGITVNSDTGLADDSTLAAGCTMHPAQFQYIVAEAATNATVSGANPEDELGIAISVALKDSKDATTEAEGIATVAATIAVTTVDTNGKVTSALIDALQTNVKFDTTGKISTDLTSDILTKNELKESYGMKQYSSIQKEWYEQAESFAQYCVGKTADDIFGIAVNDETGFVDGLATSCTMHPGNFQYVVAEAIQSAK